MDQRDRMNEYLEQFKEITDEELIRRFNEQVGVRGGVPARGAYMAAIHAEFDRRGFDYSLIGDSISLSFKNKIKLVGKKIVYSGMTDMNLHLDKDLDVVSQN
jgi:hypothetical protein